MANKGTRVLSPLGIPDFVTNKGSDGRSVSIDTKSKGFSLTHIGGAFVGGQSIPYFG
ncbi:hypothetical protein [Evansella halocellulosilytica]|uniref:hypothetical protein n=1 Tax=Evansella halocellulosilytica TaxID=2011013 RepID=UPI0015CEB8F3|nr:hypothetical protein [Evansella halocellulosilytica]